MDGDRERGQGDAMRLASVTEHRRVGGQLGKHTMRMDRERHRIGERQTRGRMIRRDTPTPEEGNQGDLGSDSQKGQEAKAARKFKMGTTRRTKDKTNRYTYNVVIQGTYN